MPLFTIIFTVIISVIYILDAFIFVPNGVKRFTKEHLLVGDKSGYIMQALKLSHEKIVHGQIWRLFTASLLHVSLLHIITNAAALLIIGYAVETELGGIKIALCFIVSTIVSGLTMAFIYKFDDGEGASPGIYGLFAVYFLLAIKNKNIIFSAAPWLLMVLAGIFFAVGFFTDRASRREHISGFIGGIIIGAPLIWF